MREIKVLKWCDVCAADGDARTEVVAMFTVTVAESGVSRGAPMVLEVCEPHSKSIRELAELAKARGVSPLDLAELAEAPAGRKRRTRAQILADGDTPKGSGPKRFSSPCPECGSTASSPSSAAGHIYRVHLRTEPPPAPRVCPECGVELEGPTAVGLHRAHNHDGASTFTDAVAALTAAQSPNEVAASVSAHPAGRKRTRARTAP